MRYVSCKLTAAILTFFIGTGLVTVWFIVESKIFEIPVISLPGESQITNSNAEIKLPETPDAAPTMTFTESASLNGKRNALRNIKKGELIVLVRGDTLFQKLLADELAKYEIEVESIGCFFDEEDEMFLGGYNEVSKAAINERFGNGFIEKAISRAARRKKEYFKNQ
jgi:hypothetical protein